MKDVLFSGNATDGTGTVTNINKLEVATEAAALSAKFPIVDSSIITIFATAKVAGVTPKDIESALKTISGEEKSKQDNIDADYNKMKADYPDADLDLLCAMAYAKSAGFESKTARSIIELCDPEEAAKKLIDADEEAAKFKKEADEAKKEVAKANEEIAKAKKEAADAKKEAADAKKEAADAKKEAADAKKEAAEAKKGTAKAAKPNDGAILLCTSGEELVDGEKLLVINTPICLTKSAVKAAQKGNESNSIRYRLYNADEQSIENKAPTEEQIEKYIVGQAEIQTHDFFDRTKIVLL